MNEHARGDVEALQLENARLARLVAQLRCSDDTVAADNAALHARLEHVTILCPRCRTHTFPNVTVFAGRPLFGSRQPSSSICWHCAT